MGLKRGRVCVCVSVCSRGVVSQPQSLAAAASGCPVQFRAGSRMGSGRGRDGHGLGGDSVATGQGRIVKWCEGCVTGCEGATWVPVGHAQVVCICSQTVYVASICIIRDGGGMGVRGQAGQG